MTAPPGCEYWRQNSGSPICSVVAEVPVAVKRHYDHGLLHLIEVVVYSSEISAHYHGREHGGVQADMVLAVS